MIPALDPFAEGEWQQLLKAALRRPSDLLTQLNLMELAPLVDNAAEFAMRVPEPFWRRMEVGNAADPLLRQVLPLCSERALTPGYSADPLAEADATATPGLVHKYHGRALVVTTGACAINCRYCFRRHFPYADHGAKTFTNLVGHVAADSSISEVILSGGDPLVLSDRVLHDLLHDLAALPHVRTLRLHSRLPIVLPQRVTANLVQLLQDLTASVSVVMVVHANHANELDAMTARAMSALRKAKITLLNQSVLLDGVNDNTTALVDLSHGLFTQGILPYYLHMPDPIQGTAHFDVKTERASKIFRDICGVLPGYLVPRLVREVAGAPGKEIINIDSLTPSFT